MAQSRVVIDLSSDAPPRGLVPDSSRERPWYKLSLPGTQRWPAFSKPAQDPLHCWPDRYSAELDTPAWARAMDWRGVAGFHKSVKADTGFEPYTVNYAFNNLFDSIPVTYDSRRHGKVLLFDARNEADAERRKRNFYAALQFIHHYPVAHRMEADLGMSQATFSQQVQPTIYSMAADVDFLDFKLRMWDYNHTEHFPERVLTTFDGFPIHVCCSSNKWVARLTKSKKYQDWVVKADLGITLTGFVVDYSLQLGVRHDARMWMEHSVRRARMHPWEYALGDKAYVGCPEFLTEYKDYGNMTAAQYRWNNILQFYRARNEHAVMEVKTGRHSLDTKWRGSFIGLAAILKIVVHMVALQERMKGPKYDCFGPWPVCPDSIVARYC
jgi:hypothetical protein